MLFPVHLTLWFNFLFLWASKIEASVNSSAVCQGDLNTAYFHPPVDEKAMETRDIETKSDCLLYPTNVVSCSWSLDHLQATQVVPHVSICDSEILLQSWNRSTAERVGSASITLQEFDDLEVALQFTITLLGDETVYTKIYDKRNLEVPPPPGNISSWLEGKNLKTNWSLPKTGVPFESHCFTYQLDIGDGGGFRNIPTGLSGTVENVDPSQTHRVRMRTIMSHTCQVTERRSEWSHVVVVEASVSHFNWLVIVLILLGIPMILLALLLLVRYLRVCKTFFPPIPSPPPKYMYFLEKSDGFNIDHSCTPVEEEVITVVLCE